MFNFSLSHFEFALFIKFDVCKKGFLNYVYILDYWMKLKKMADTEDCQLSDLQSEFKKLRVDFNKYIYSSW